MFLHFQKYHGAGNDFIIIDLNKNTWSLSDKEVAFLCNRHFGIGADGLILLKKHPDYDFEMIYYNSDGIPATMCGNGGRCIVSFAFSNGYIKNQTTFLASDGIHEAEVVGENYIRLKMQDVKSVQKFDDGYFINTGSPHFVTFNYDLNKVNVFEKGKEIRHELRFGNEGTNVNFCHIENNHSLTIYTFERGVENETLACGTGSVASAIALYQGKPDGDYSVNLQAKGGKLNVSFRKEGENYSNIWLSGPATFVFEGTLNLK